MRQAKKLNKTPNKLKKTQLLLVKRQKKRRKFKLETNGRKDCLERSKNWKQRQMLIKFKYKQNI